MPQVILIGAAAGLASAALFASALYGGMGGRLLIYFLAPLPLFLAGLGWGTIAALVAAIGAALGSALLLSPATGVVVFASQGLPVFYICHLAQLRRTVAASPGDIGGAPEAVEWYPVGRLVAIATVFAGAVAFITVWMLGDDLDQIRTLLRGLIEKVFLQSLPGLKDRSLGEQDIALLTEFALYALPATSAFSWLGSFAANLYLAGRITLASGRLPRPWPDLASLTYPRGFGLGLAASLTAAGLLTGYPALLASGFAGAFFLAYVLLGLAVVHSVTRGRPARALILWGVYIALVVLNPWAPVALALIGTLEPTLRRRRRSASGPAAPPD